jgi:hypothetical protein
MIRTIAFTVFAGAASLMSPFSIFYIVFTCVVIYTLQKKIGWPRAILAATIGGSLLWVGIFATYRALLLPLLPRIDNPVASAGFPFIAFLYPRPPLGNKVPPLEQWPFFFIDYMLCLIAGTLASIPFPKTTMRDARIIGTILLLLNLYGLGYTLLKFE